MATAVLTLPLRTQEDVLLTRRRARDLAALLQFTPAEQIGLSTAVWEVARMAERRGEGELAVVEAPPSVAVRITVSGVPHSVLTDTGGGGPGIVDELRQQNFELLTTLATLREREQELTELNTELGDTNLAVTALYRELEVQAEELRRRAEANARFLSELTHELRTPLYAVRGMTEAILRDHADDLSEGIRQDVTLIDGAMVEALDLVNDHLDLAKLAAGRTTVRLAAVDVGELFTTLRAIVTRLPASAGVELLFDEAGELPRLHTDGFKLSQILRNFTVNALKFTAAGHVRISAHAVDDHR